MSSKKEAISEMDKLKRYQNLKFLNGKVLDDRIQGAMAKYGLKYKDDDVMDMISQSLQSKFKDMLKNVIDVGRYSQISFYLTNSKTAQEGDISKITTFNTMKHHQNKYDKEYS